LALIFNTLSNPQISIVAPLYNESETFTYLIKRLNEVMAASPLLIEIGLIDDGSRDTTALLMQTIALSEEPYHCLY